MTRKSWRQPCSRRLSLPLRLPPVALVAQPLRSIETIPRRSKALTSVADVVLPVYPKLKRRATPKQSLALPLAASSRWSQWKCRR
jgi:hypothetical protein